MATVPTFKMVHITTVPQTLGFFHGQVGFLKEHGVEVALISSPGELADRFSQEEAVRFYPVTMKRQIIPITDLTALLQLWYRILRIKPDIVHSHTPKAGLLGTIAARLAHVPVIFLSVFGLPQMTRTGFRRRLLDCTTWLACQLADRVWCDSQSMRDYIVSAKLCADSKTVVLGHGSVNGVDAQHRFSPQLYSAAARSALRNRYGIPDKARVLGFVGRIVADKGMSELVDAWRLLREKYSDLHMLLVGPFEAEDPLRPQDEVMLRGDPRVHLVGYQPDVASYLAVMDLFVMPSYREGFGLANIEAAAMELPVISTRIPGCVDSVQDGVTGILVPPRDSRSLASAIELYLNNPDLVRRHGRAGRQRVLHDFRPEVIWEALYQEYTASLAVKTR